MSGAKCLWRAAALVSLSFMAVLAVVAPNIEFGSGAAPGLTATVGAEATEEATVRISAKRLANGRTQMGLQVWTDGAWDAERLSPARKFLPANGRVGTWFRSGTIELPSGHVVRIGAQPLESGQIEFRLVEVVDGEDGEPMLPTERLLPRSAEVGVWHNTSPLVLADPNPPELPPGYTPAVDASGWVGTAIEFSSWYDAEGVHTWVRSRARYENDAEGRAEAFVAAGGRLYLTQSCLNSDELSLQIDGLPVQDGALLVMTSESDEPEMSDARVVEVDLTIDDGDVETQFWSWGVTIDPAAQYVSAGDETSDLLASLREASSVTSEVIGSGLPAATFDLNGMFDTRVQGNIDECGNYTDPDWTPVTEAQSGTTEAGASYTLDYPEWNDGQRRTLVRINASGETTGPDGQPVSLATGCQEGWRWFQLGGLPAGEGEYTVRSRVDDGLWIDEQWRIRTADRGWIYANPVSDIDYERLRSGTTVEYEIPLSPVVRLTFDLAALFSTPVQANVDNCGVPVWPLTYVPLVNVDGNRGELRYEAYHWRDEVHSRIINRVSVDDAPLGNFEFTNACYGGRRVTFGPFELTDAEFRNVTLQIDDVVLPAEPWRQQILSLADGTEAAQVSAPDVHALIGQLRGASSLTVTIDGSGLPRVTFDLAGMFDTPIQENIDECGNYKEGETRELPAELNTSGSVETGDDGSRIQWNRSQGPGGIPSTSLSQIGPFEQESGLQFYMTASCGHTGTQMYLFGSRLGELSVGDLEVSWSVDSGTEQREVWRVSDWGTGTLLAHPNNAVPVLQAWRDGQTMALTVHTATPHTEQIDLAAFFGTPVQSSLDECLAIPRLDLSTPAGEISRTVDGDLIYGSGKLFGNHLASTSVMLLQGDTPQSRLILEIACGSERVGVLVTNVGRGQFLAVSSEAVEVTWSVDSGAPQTTTWDVWESSSRYSISPPDDAAFYAAIKDAGSLTVSVASDPVTMLSFDLAGNGFWSTPVQPNLDACDGS